MRSVPLTAYIMSGFDGHDALLAKMGKHTTGTSCSYIDRLADVDTDVLEELVSLSGCAGA